MIRVIGSAVVYPITTATEACLYTRREMFPDGSYKEYSYIGPTEEVQALADQCIDVDMEKVDDLLAGGSSFEEALTKLGVP